MSRDCWFRREMSTRLLTSFCGWFPTPDSARDYRFKLNKTCMRALDATTLLIRSSRCTWKCLGKRIVQWNPDNPELFRETSVSSSMVTPTQPPTQISDLDLISQ